MIEIRRTKVSRVHTLPHVDAWIESQTRMDLTMADVDGDDRLGTRLKETIRKSAGRSADVEASPTGRIQSEILERRREFLTPARYESTQTAFDADDALGGDSSTGFIARLVIDEDASGQNQRLGRTPTRRQSLAHDTFIEAFALQAEEPLAPSTPSPPTSLWPVDARSVVTAARMSLGARPTLATDSP